MLQVEVNGGIEVTGGTWPFAVRFGGAKSGFSAYGSWFSGTTIPGTLNSQKNLSMRVPKYTK